MYNMASFTERHKYIENITEYIFILTYKYMHGTVFDKFKFLDFSKHKNNIEKE